MALITVQNLTFFYPEQSAPALENVSFSLEAGEFLVLCGPSGCGKSTLLRQLKPALAPHGRRSGELLLDGVSLDALDVRTQAARIGFVRQSPENQIVTDKVWHELAFALESLGYDTPTIRRRTAEMAAFFGMEDWFYQDTAALSGGQKQLLNLASAMVLQPDLLILDEPTSQLDPIAASEFLSILGRLNRELGTTILLTEHRLEEAFPLASRVLVLDEGRLLCEGTPREVGTILKEQHHPMFRSLPTPMRVWAAVETDALCPITAAEGRRWLMNFAKTHPLQPLPEEKDHTVSGAAAIDAHELWFRYEKGGADVLKGLTLQVKQGEFLALLGGNGAGKTTALRLLAGVHPPYRGQVRTQGRAALLPQDPKMLFAKKTVREDLGEHCPPVELLARTVRLCRLEGLLDRHPYDLSGGEQQRAALAKVLLSDPDILLLDEPTKGLDAEFKEIFAQILRTLLRRGVTVVMVSHDVEFCARYAHRCALFFDGAIVASDTPRRFFTGNRFYTTSAHGMARDIIPGAVTAEDIIFACHGNLPEEAKPAENGAPLPSPMEAPDRPAPLPKWRKALGTAGGVGAVGLLWRFLRASDLSQFLSAGGLTALSGKQLGLYGAFLLCAVVFALSITRRSALPEAPQVRGALSRRTRFGCAAVLLLIPVTLLASSAWGWSYRFTALLVVLEAMAPFFLRLEGRKPQPRELVLIASLCAIGVAGRAAFFMLPECKPVLALTILSGVAFGGESGFLVGAVTMLVSNVMFSQGPWMPWQMFAMGIIGFLAGVLFRKGLLHRSRGTLCIFGALSAILIYGGIMNPVSALLSGADLSAGTLAAYYLTGFPVDCIHAAATWLFLWLGAELMLEKMDRIKVKYGWIL